VQRRHQTATAFKAHRHKLQWTGPELEIASRADLSASDVARMLGRSYWAVTNIRKKLKNPMLDQVAGASRAEMRK
jgi:hypothetical protein